jgi:hypothetical protein
VIETRRAGDALASALGGAAGPHSTDAGRALLLALIRLHCLGALSFRSHAEAVHGPRPEGEPGAVVGCGPATPGPTAPTYNMGSLSASGCDAE